MLTLNWQELKTCEFKKKSTELTTSSLELMHSRNSASATMLHFGSYHIRMHKQLYNQNVLAVTMITCLLMYKWPELIQIYETLKMQFKPFESQGLHSYDPITN